MINSFHLRLIDVKKSFDGTTVVPSLTLDCPPGQLTVLLGPSGCGKTTLLRMIAGLETPDGGEIRLGASDLRSVPAALRPVSMVFQNYALFPHLTVAQNITFGLRMAKVPKAELNARLDRVATMMSLIPLLARKPRQLSGGQQQRVALARAIISEHPVCLMDEPLSNLDAKLRLDLRDEIRALQQSLGLTMIYVTHDQTEAMALADQMVILADGRIRQVGTPQDVYREPADLFCAGFIGQLPMNLIPSTQLSAHLPSLPAHVWVGIRPEDIELDAPGFEATVRKVEYLGPDQIVHLELGDLHLVARVNARASAFLPGRRCQVRIPPDAIHLFDQSTESRISSSLMTA